MFSTLCTKENASAKETLLLNSLNRDLAARTLKNGSPHEEGRCCGSRVSNDFSHTTSMMMLSSQLHSSSVQLSSVGTAPHASTTTWLDLLVNYCKRQLVQSGTERLAFT